MGFFGLQLLITPLTGTLVSGVTNYANKCIVLEVSFFPSNCLKNELKESSLNN